MTYLDGAVAGEFGEVVVEGEEDAEIVEAENAAGMAAGVVDGDLTVHGGVAARLDEAAVTL